MIQNVLNWIESAGLGWTAYMDGGKLAALALAAALFMGLTVGKRGNKGLLVLYGSLMMVLCICPITAAGLMAYQTRFYDYQWIWSMVPVTALIALGGTVFLTEEWKASGGMGRFRALIVTVASVLVVVLCGGLGAGSVDTVAARQRADHAENVLAKVRTHCGTDVCLWAPAKVLEYARLDGETKLLYGRNMWDAALNAYSYDAYSEEQKELYVWMEKLDDWQIEITVDEVEEYVNRAYACGADCILLPTEMSDWLVEPESETVLLERLEKSGAGVNELEGYYLLDLR